ncbi:universal stress protein, partial [Kineococcus gynurae]|uniref:universal stress protein n=1 Tax=Kineococcus gynurae TaxID=452979 RepID=UPI003D7DE85C
MTIVVGWTPSPQGEAALTFALDEADRRGEELYVLNTSKGDRISDPRYADDDQLAEARRRLEESGIGFEIVQEIDPRGGAEHVLDAAERVSASAIVIGGGGGGGAGGGGGGWGGGGGGGGGGRGGGGGG